MILVAAQLQDDCGCGCFRITAPERIARSFSGDPKALPCERPCVDDRVDLSTEGRNRHAAASTHDSPAGSAEDLAPSEHRKVDELKRRDQDVQAHEQAHLTLGRALYRTAVVAAEVRKRPLPGVIVRPAPMNATPSRNARESRPM